MDLSLVTRNKEQMSEKSETESVPCNSSCTHCIRDGSSAVATSKLERFVIIVNGWKPLTIITKCSILDITAALNPSLPEY